MLSWMDVLQRDKKRPGAMFQDKTRGREARSLTNRQILSLVKMEEGQSKQPHVTVTEFCGHPND